MFDIGFGEMVLLAAIALIAIGPKQLPEVARTIGRLLNEFKRATGEFQRTLSDASDNSSTTLSEVRNSLSKVMEPTMQQLNQVVEPMKDLPAHLESQLSMHHHHDSHHHAQTPMGQPIDHDYHQQPDAIDEKDQMSFDLNSAPPKKDEPS